MTERFTTIRPRERGHLQTGLAEYGRVSRSHMLAYYRDYYQSQLDSARAALALTDEQLIVETGYGVYVHHGWTEVTDE